MKPAYPLVFAALLAGSDLAAQVRLAAYGLVKPEGMSICATKATHVFECSRLRLNSRTLNLVPFEGQYVRAEGILTPGGAACTVLEVDKIGVVQEYGTASGTWRTGSVVQFAIHGSPGSLQVLFLSPGKPRLMPAGPVGMFYLDIALYFPVVFLPIPGTGSSPWPLKIPNDPVLVGLELVFQSGYIVMPLVAPIMANAICGKIL